MAKKIKNKNVHRTSITKLEEEKILQMQLEHEKLLQMQQIEHENQALNNRMYELNMLYQKIASDEEMLNSISDADKTKTVIIKKMAEESDTSIETLAEYLDCKPQSLRNKMFRDSFSIDDLLIVAHACNFSVILRNNKTNEDSEIDFVGFFRPMMDEVLIRASELDNRAKKEKREEYEKLKARLEKMKSEYGFDDD